MKLAKKMLASVCALAMVVALALTAFATNVTMTNATADVGETVTITVAGTGIAGLEAADLVFTYDAEALEYVSVKGADGIEYSMAAGGNPSKGTVTFSFAFLEAATADSNMAVVTFKVLKAGASDVVLSYNSWEGTAEPAAVKVTVTGKEVVSETTTVKEEVSVDETTTVKAPVDTTKAPEVPKTGDVGVAAVAGVMAIAAVAFVATRKKDAE
ncbi:MAG: hypothetical protein IKV76_04585 [Clostridia bacterium]|nr:hypothetical protein [Clostridia bacterium]